MAGFVRTEISAFVIRLACEERYGRLIETVGTALPGVNSSQCIHSLTQKKGNGGWTVQDKMDCRKTVVYSKTTKCVFCLGGNADDFSC